MVAVGDAPDAAGSTLADVLARGRDVWGNVRLDLPQVATRLAVVVGDLCRLARDAEEGAEVDHRDVARELGNAVASSVRWMDDLGLDVGECLELAFSCQREYVARRR